MKFLAFNETLPIEKGMRAEFDKKTPALSVLWRKRDMIYGLVGGKVQGLRHRAVPAQPGLRQSELPRHGQPGALRHGRPRGRGDVVHRAVNDITAASRPAMA